MRHSLSIFAAVLVVTFAGCATPVPDPIYRNRHLSSWLGNYDVGSKSWPHEEAHEAIRYFGETAMPMVQRMLKPIRSQDYEFHTNHRRAIAACHALGPVAEPALPGLQRLAREDEMCRPYAESAIGVITGHQ